MSDGNWRGPAAYLILFVVLVPIAALVSWQLGSIHVQRLENEYRAAYYEQYAEDRVARECAGLAGPPLIKCVHEEIESAREHERSERDIDAQMQMAKWAFWLLILSVFTVIVTGLGVVFVWQNLEEDRKANKAGLRAYVGIDAVKLVGWPSAPEVTITFKNYGQTPATGLPGGVPRCPTGRL